MELVADVRHRRLVDDPALLCVDHGDEVAQVDGLAVGVDDLGLAERDGDGLVAGDLADHGGDLALLADITRAAGGPEDLAEHIGHANTARHAAELWDQAGLLPAAGRELCARAARVLSRFSAEIAGPETEPPQVRVIMVDFTGQQKIAESAA